MNRRAFLEWTTLGAAQALGADRVLADSSQRARPAPAFRLRRFEWEEATIGDLQAAMAKGRQTAVSLVRAYLRRIEDLNQRGPALRAVIEVNPEALAIAKDLDESVRPRDRAARSMVSPCCSRTTSAPMTA